jgi:serine/threonine protein kinase
MSDLRSLANSESDTLFSPGVTPSGGPDQLAPGAAPSGRMTSGEFPPVAARRYRMLDEIGRGGMGRVVRAIDEEFRREVALKEIAPDYTESREHVARFLREARVTGRLEHPGIVPVYDLGRRRTGGRESLYYTMKLVRGRTLKQALTEFHKRFGDRPVQFRSVEGQRLLDAFIALCNAVAFAHSRGVIHRDLKPDNVMLGDYGETVLLDWGLAKVLSQEVELDDGGGGVVVDVEVDAGEVDSRLDYAEYEEPPDPTDYGRTEFGAVMGTPQYLAPEQAAGRKDLLDRQADVYSLGVVLFQILTGALPFGDAKPLEVLQLVQERDPDSPRRRRRGVPTELAAVCLKALSRDRAVRYRSAGDLAMEVRRWIADQPVEAFPEAAWRKVRRWVKTHRTLVACALVALGLNIAKLGYEWAEGYMARRRAAGEQREVWENNPWARYRRGLAALRNGRPMEARTDLMRAVEAEPENPLPYIALAVALSRTGLPNEADDVSDAAETRLRAAFAKGLLTAEVLSSEEAYQLAVADPHLRTVAVRWVLNADRPSDRPAPPSPAEPPADAPAP